MTAKEKVIKERILVGLEITREKLLKFKKERNHNFIVSEGGKVVKISPLEVEHI